MAEKRLVLVHQKVYLDSLASLNCYAGVPFDAQFCVIVLRISFDNITIMILYDRQVIFEFLSNLIEMAFCSDRVSSQN